MKTPIDTKFGSMGRSSTRTASMAIDAASYTSGYGFGGYDTSQSLLEPIWWDNQRIQDTVTEAYVHDKIPHIPGSGLREKLNQPMAFGNGLTDTTYLEWIMEKAPRLFLILLKMGLPEQIFGVVDDSWDDDDLPIAADQVARLKLSYQPDPALDKRFFRKQFYFLLKDIPRGGHVEFEDDDVIPLELEQRKSGISFSQNIEDRVSLPRGQGNVFLRRKTPLGDGPSLVKENVFLTEAENAKSVTHPHIVEVFASYTYQGAGYLLQSPACDNTLKSFLQTPPPLFKQMNRHQKRRQLLVWCHCLSDAIAYLNDKGIVHEDIRPRSILLEGTNIYFADFGNSKALETASRKVGNDSIESERFEYGAPEIWGQTSPTSAISMSTSNPTSLTSFSSSVPKSPITIFFPRQKESVSSSSEGSASTVNEVRVSSLTNSSTYGDWMSTSNSRSKTSVFSLACVFLDVLSFHFKKKTHAFTTHRAHRKRRTARSGSMPDSSFHNNLSQVSSWIEILDHDAAKTKDGEDRAMRQVLLLCQEMLQLDPNNRPGPAEVRDRLWTIVKAEGGMPHCGCVGGNSPGREHMEELALLGRHDGDWEWPWESGIERKFTRNGPWLEALGE